MTYKNYTLVNKTSCALSNVVPFRQRPNRLSRKGFQAEAIKMVRAGKLRMSYHLVNERAERMINQAQVEKCIEKGTVACDPYIDRNNWCVEMYRHLAGEELTVILAIDWDRKLIVVTAYVPKR